MQDPANKSFDTADETRQFPNGQAEILQVAGVEIGRFTLEPGWKWSADVKPTAGTDSCQASHFSYHLSGRLAVKMDDGTELTVEPGEVSWIPGGHDAWVVGDDPVIAIDWAGASNYAKEG